MTKRMLIDASHAEETRVVMLDGSKLEDFDVETAGRKQIKGNIYLAKVIRVEPSLQAAFVEYGGNRHGFLAFGEIHPDYYQIPVADRQKLLAMQAEEDDEDSREDAARDHDAPLRTEVLESTQALEIKPIEIVSAPPPAELHPEAGSLAEPSGTPTALTEELTSGAAPAAEAMPAAIVAEPLTPGAPEGAEALTFDAVPELSADSDDSMIETVESNEAVETITPEDDGPSPEQLGGDGDDAAEARERRMRQRFLRNYKIQDVIHRRQIMLIQVVKEERGNKGAALTTYLSLAGRFSVLMPNSPTGGGVSRKITSQADRRRLKEAMNELDVPQGMGLIVRTAGANRPKPEIKRDCEYLLRLWDDIRDKTMESTAPALIYEEANLIKRAIRDVYTRDVEEILVDGQEAFRAARDFMRMLMPSHANKVQAWGDGQPLFAKYQVEAQLDAMLNPIVQLRSGGYIVINQTEALVAIDVNSGRSTRERSIEDTALRTNMEAAEEAAKQLRMRDLAGLIVIDFIDMESRKNNAAVERKLKDSLKHDRARIQVGSISHFGLMEMSRQRLRPSLTEASLIACPHCAGQGHIRSPESAALHILRAIEDEGGKFRAAEISVVLPQEIAFYLFNHKRERLSVIEARYNMRVLFTPDATMAGTNFRIERLRAQTAPPPVPAPVRPERQIAAPVTPDAEEIEDETETETTDTSEGTAEEKADRKRRRRRRGKRRDDRPAPDATRDAARDTGHDAAPGRQEAGADEGDASPGYESSPAEQPSEIDLILEAALGAPADEPEPMLSEPAPEEATPKRRRPRTRRRRADGTESEAQGEATAAAAPAPVFTDIADIFEAAERAEEIARAARRAKPARATAVEAPVMAPEMPEAPVPLPEALAPEALAEIPVPREPHAPSAPAAPAAGPAAGPAVKPIVIGAAERPAEKKQGWWRR
ncbi:ribonuclease E/G [Acidocella sp.]|uniref:Rne/Rng family ribonuclease n=1 Tax=Acidocella sp. TaxID=50710 RepID=UPI00263279AE|nr:ribonuclease E/G [Acidocella sp.]